MSRHLPRALKFVALFVAFGIASWLAMHLHGGGLWEGLAPAVASTADPKHGPSNYDLRQLKVVNEVLKNVRDKYVDPKRVKPKEMLLSSLNYVQRDVAQIIVMHDDPQPTVKIRVDTQEREFRVDNVLGLWDVSARLREIFDFVQENLKGTDVDLREVEYAACNGMLHTLDPHSVLLSPEAYKEMNLSTSGQFGGLGIVISIRDQQLTVINPMPQTPASRAGVRKYDRITKIGGESTLNMGLNEAVQHLRGAPGTKVTVWLRRDGPDGWQQPKPFELTREVIKVASVESKGLGDGIGYVRIKQFQANTAKDLDEALLGLKKNGEIKGLVLDLRGNPGGLLEQAARVADKFLVSGPIVATVGNPGSGEDREEKVAHADGTEPNYPIALLVNGTSASASEIVAGALKNHDRAILIGETTFGKGSVQLVFTELPDRAALKLTIAQYLTEPGDISIQGTGVTPDIELDPMTADTQEMDLTVDTGTIKERDLSRSLSNARAREGQKPQEVVRYNLPESLRRELRDRGGDPDEVLGPDFPSKDFPVKFGRDIVAKVPHGKRLEQVRAAKQIIADTRTSELQKVAGDLQQLGIDWSDAPADVQQVAAGAPPPNVDVKLETDKPSNEASAGDSINLKVTVTNKGTVPLHRLAAMTKSDNGLYDNKELVIGRVDPGKSKTASIPLGWCEVEGHKVGSTAPLPKDAPRTCRIPRDTLSRQDGISVKFDEARGRAPGPQSLRVGVKALERPIFAYSYQIADSRKGNGDGKVQKGEHLTMYVSVKNVGKGKSFDTQANLRNLSGDGLLLHEGRFDISNMQPGEVKKLTFAFDVESALADPEAKVELSIADRDLRETIVEKVRMPIAVPSTIAQASGSMKARSGGATLLESPEPGARTFGRLGAGTGVTVLGTAGDLTKVSLGDARFGFVKSSELENGGAPAAVVAFEETMRRFPPAVEVQPVALAVKDDKILIKGTAADGDKILDGYVFVGNKKVFYRSNRNGNDLQHMSFDTSVPLRPGVNIITVVARENVDTIGRKTLVVRRDGPNGEILPTPKTEEEGETGAADDEHRPLRFIAGLGFKECYRGRAMRLHVNIDHVATLRNARGTPYPDPVDAARACLDAGAHGITAHLREDRRHIVDADVTKLRAALRATFNLEMAATDEMVAFAVATRPDVVTLVPERREERTTEGGLAVAGAGPTLARHVEALQAAEIKVSLFIAPDLKEVDASSALGVEQIELHTGEYAHSFGYGRTSSLDLLRAVPEIAQREHARLANAAKRGRELGLEVAAGHGLTTRNVPALITIEEIVELNIGHALVADAVFLSLGGAVKAMLAAIAKVRRP